MKANKDKGKVKFTNWLRGEIKYREKLKLEAANRDDIVELKWYKVQLEILRIVEKQLPFLEEK